MACSPPLQWNRQTASVAPLLPKGPIALSTLRTSAGLAMCLVVQPALPLLTQLLGPSNFRAFAAEAALTVLHGVMSTFSTHLALLPDRSSYPSRRQHTLPPALGTTSLGGMALLALYLAIFLIWLRTAGMAPCYRLHRRRGNPAPAIPRRLGDGTARAGADRGIATAPCIATATSPLLLLSDLLDWIREAIEGIAVWHLAAVAVVLAVAVCLLPQAWPPMRRWRTADLPERHEKLRLCRAGPERNRSGRTGQGTRRASAAASAGAKLRGGVTRRWRARHPGGGCSAGRPPWRLPRRRRHLRQTATVAAPRP